MAAKYSTGALVAVGLGAWIIGLGMGGRVMAQYCVEACPDVLNRNQRRRRRRVAGQARELGTYPEQLPPGWHDAGYTTAGGTSHRAPAFHERLYARRPW